MSSSSRTSGFSATPLPGMSAQDDSGTAHGHVDSGHVADLAVRPRAKRTPDFVPQKSRRLPPDYLLQHCVQMCAFIENSSLHHYLVAIKLVSIIVTVSSRITLISPIIIFYIYFSKNYMYRFL